MKNMIKLVDNHTLFVEGADDRISAANILEENFSLSPLGAMFLRAGVFTLAIGKGRALNVPYRKVRLDDKNIRVKNTRLEVDGALIEGVSIDLPADVVRLQAAWDAARVGMPYNWTTFLDDYQKDLEKIGSLMFDHVDTARIDGLMAQVISNPGVGENQVGLNTKTMKQLHQRLITAGHDELESVDTLDGMWVLLQRYPVVSPTGARWVQLVMIKGAVSNKLLVNAKAWKELHDGDEDGDTGYIGINSTAKFGTVEPELELPAVVMTARDDLPEVKDADPVQTVMNMRARSLVGSQHQFFHGLARACAVRASNCTGVTCDSAVRGGKDGFDKAYRGIFKVYHPMAEGVFDKRKSEGGSDTFAALVTQMENHLTGVRVEAEAFFPFLEDETLRTKLTGALDMVGHSTRIAKATAFGRLLVGGDGNRHLAFGAIVEGLDANGVAPEDMIAALQNDALGKKIQPINLPNPRNREEREYMGVKLIVSKELKTVRDIFEKITFNNQAVLKVIDVKEFEDGTNEVKLRLIPVWKQGSKCPMFTVQIPKISKIAGTEDHRFLNVPGLTTRMFCPIFRMTNGEVELVKIKLWFAEMVATGIESFSKRRGKNIDEKRFQAHMDRHIRKAIRELVSINSEEGCEDEGIRETLVRMSEYRVEVSDDSLSGELAKFEEILNHLKDMGLDITTTSKNHPGRIVTKAWKCGIPRFIWSVNPFANLLDMKRKVEVREIRKALEFVNPIPVPLKTKGVKLPVQFSNVLTTLNVAIMDLPGWNVFEGTDGEFCFDTLLVTDSGIEKLKVNKLKFNAQDAEQRDQIKEKLLREGFDEDQIHIEEVIEASGSGLTTVMYDILVKGEIKDIGKIKSAVGPIKGVMNPVPFRMFDANGNEIDIIVPHDTIVRKRAVDAVQYMMAAAGLTEIDPDNQPELPVIKTMVMLDGVEIGEAIVGLLPFFRPVQTGRGTFDIRTGAYGIKVQYHSIIMSKGVDEVDFHNTPDWVAEEFAQIINTRKEVMNLKSTTVEEEQVPMPVECV